MKCKGNFKYKGIKKRDSGIFQNDKGEEIKYKECYLIKLDEVTESGVYERTFKIATDSQLLNTLSQIQLYQDVLVEFEVQIFATTCRLIPVNVTVVK